MWTALTLWSLFPTEIESDLLPKADIYDWHRGSRDRHGLKLSSRRLLALLTHLPDDSAYRAGLRDGGYSHAETVAAETHNELARLRSSYHIVNGGEEAAYEPREFVDPLVQRLRDDIAQTQEQEQEQSSETLYSDLGWT